MAHFVANGWMAGGGSDANRIGVDLSKRQDEELILFPLRALVPVPKLPVSRLARSQPRRV